VRLEPGAQADPDRDVIVVDGRRIEPAAARTYLLLHKPRGYVTTRADPRGRAVVLDLLPRGPARVFPVGRLDAETEGLLLLTDDGPLANYLLHPRYEIPRVYDAQVEGRVREADLPRWRAGAVLEDGPAVPKEARVLRTDGTTTWMQLTFAEGRKREVRRYAQALGHPVRRLIRVQFGPLRLGSLRVGASRPLTEVELAALNRLRGGNPSPILRGLDR